MRALEDQRGNQIQKGDSQGNYTKLNNLFSKTNWEMEFHGQNTEHCYGIFCGICSEGIRRPLAVNSKKILEKREGMV